MSKRYLYFKTLLIYLAIIFLVFAVFLLIDMEFEEVSLEGFESNEIPRYALILLGVLVAPLIETFFFQFLMYKLADKFFRMMNKKIIFFVSAGLFALTHYYSWFFMLYAFAGGLLFIFYYHKLKIQFGTLYAFAGLFIIHSLFNLILFALDPVFERILV